jgi:hypothetical protein
MAKAYESDLYRTGKSEIVLENSCLKVIISPHLGGRIVNVSAGERQFLYSTYPEGGASELYTEFGGIEEFLERPPGILWRSAWQFRIDEDRLNLCFKQEHIFVEKRISLDESLPVVKIEYSLLNVGPNLLKRAFGIHSEICLDSDASASRYHIPVKEGILSGGREQTRKRYVRPSQGWCAGTCQESLIAMLFPDRLLDGVEVHYPMAGTHLSLSPLIYYVGLAPGKEARFACAIYFGKGNADFAAELWKSCVDELPRQYISVPKDRLEMAKSFENPEGEQMPAGAEDSEERQLLLEKMSRFEEHKSERMEILHLLHEKQITAAEAVERFRVMKRHST